MGPKNCAVVPSKDLSWIDRMYMKFETMCVEVDKNPSLLLQETSKYVENQVNAMGANVKKLCTELIQDMISAPVLASEGVEKNLECAVHCKCHCMEIEKPKLSGNDKAGGQGEEDNFNDNFFEKQSSMKKEVSKVDLLNADAAIEPPACKFSGMRGQELSNIQGQVQTNDGESLNTAVSVLDTGESGRQSLSREKTRPVKGILGCAVQHGGDCGKLEISSSNTVKEESKNASKEIARGMEAAVCRGEAGFSEQASRPGGDRVEESGQSNGCISNNLNNSMSVLGSAEGNWQFQIEVRTGRLADLSNSHTLDIKLQNVVDREGLQSQEVKEVITEGGSFWTMYSHHFSEPSRFAEADDPIIVSEYESEEVCDDEQSAHWFAGQDLRKALQPEGFSVEAFTQGECFVNESDLDWELL